MKADMITTIVGGIGAAAAAAQPVLEAAGGGQLHQADYFQLIAAIAFAVISWFTGKRQPAAD
jgi:hypothetical protein